MAFTVMTLYFLFLINSWISTTFRTTASSTPAPVAAPVAASTTQAPTESRPRKFVLRLDDVEDYNNSLEQQNFIQWCMDNDVSVSVGIIGGFFGEDTALKTKIQSCIKLGEEKCEIFNHGMDALFQLTNDFTQSALENTIRDCHNIISTIFNGYQAVTMVPHRNKYGSNLLAALKEMNYSVVSTSNNEGMYENMTSSPKQMPQQAETAEFVDGDFVKVSQQQTLSDCENAYKTGDDTCVIMSRPIEFANGQYTLEDLDKLMTLLEGNGWISTTFRAAAGAAPTPTLAPDNSVAQTGSGPKTFMLGFEIYSSIFLILLFMLFMIYKKYFQDIQHSSEAYRKQ